MDAHAHAVLDRRLEVPSDHETRRDRFLFFVLQAEVHPLALADAKAGNFAFDGDGEAKSAFTSLMNSDTENILSMHLLCHKQDKPRQQRGLFDVIVRPILFC